MADFGLLYSNANGLTPLENEAVEMIVGVLLLLIFHKYSGDREEDDPYVEASQARMVYFVNDEVNKDWSVVVHLKPRDSYNMGEMKMMKHARMSHG
ncbi:uncharacterized protein DS421_17g589590 [Arachis hypogaea]|nr:uncharacterized protein DS421_17g589590 [Arachis hypogaea]